MSARTGRLSTDLLRWLDQCAAAADIHPRTLRKLITQGRGPMVTVVGRQLKIRADHWQQWLDSLATSAPPPLSTGHPKAKASVAA